MRVYSINHTPSSRAGFSLLELFVAGILLAAIFSAIGPTVYSIQRAQRTTEQQQFAILELSSLMEQVFAQTDPVTDDSLSRLRLSQSTLELLPEAVLTSELTSTGANRKIKLLLKWADASGQTVQPVQLVAWMAESDPEASSETASRAIEQEGAL